MKLKNYWKEVEEMGWGKPSDDYCNYSVISRKFFAKWGKRKMEEIRKFVGRRVSELYLRCDKWEKENRQLDIGSNDGFSDVLHHIIGLGKAAFEAAIIDPVLIETRYNAVYNSDNGYTESFVYCFQEPEPDLPLVPQLTQEEMLSQIKSVLSKESKKKLLERIMYNYSDTTLAEVTKLYIDIV